MTSSIYDLSPCQDEIIEVVISALEKFHWENREIAFWVKSELDKRLGCSWHVVVGEEFGFDITYEVRGCEPGGSTGTPEVVDCSEELLRQRSYAIKNQLGHPKPKSITQKGVFYFLLDGSLWHRDSWLPCTERINILKAPLCHKEPA